MPILKTIQSIQSNEGQSTVEFTLTLILLFSYVLFYFQLCMIFSFGNYVHYATFMSARTYLSSRLDRGDQVERAQGVLVKMLKRSISQPRLDRFPIIAKGFGAADEVPGMKIDPPDQYNPIDMNVSWMQGVRYTFKSKLFLLPFGSASDSGSVSTNVISLTSESWLGREPAYDECQNNMKGFLFDNGC